MKKAIAAILVFLLCLPLLVSCQKDGDIRYSMTDAVGSEPAGSTSSTAETTSGTTEGATVTTEEQWTKNY